MEEKRDHFLGKTVREHLAEGQARSCASDAHGLEERSGRGAFFDGFRDTALIVGAVYFLIGSFPFHQKVVSLVVFGTFCCFWKGIRAAIHAWTYLKKVHRISYEERCEILVNRDQEREELQALYQDKGFSGPLLERVVDVLMSDHERLLQVMLQEELGLKLIAIDHPLHTAFWTFLGSLLAVMLSSLILFFLPMSMSWIVLSLLAGYASSLLAYKERSVQIKTFVWTALAAAASFQIIFSLTA